jgi:hypothetical protein
MQKFYERNVSFDVLTAIKIPNLVSWILTPIDVTRLTLKSFGVLCNASNNNKYVELITLDIQNI